MSLDRKGRQKQAMRARLVAGQGRSGIPPLALRHLALAEAALGAHTDLEALVATSRPSPWRAITRLLEVLLAQPETFSDWAELCDEMAAAVKVADDDPNLVASLLGHLDDALDELRRLAP